MDAVDPIMADIERFTRAAQEAQARELERRLTYPANQGNPFHEVRLPLASIPSGGLRVDLSGHELYYRREGSVPGGRLNIDLGGATFRALYPGARLSVPFESFTVTLDERSANVGEACLVLVSRAGMRFEEPPYDDIPGSPFEPVFLLGSEDLGTHVVTYSPVDLDEEPADSSFTGAFHTQGFSRLRVLIDNTADAGTLTDVTIIPWIQYPGGFRNTTEGDELWYEVGSEAIVLPDSDTTAEDKRAFLIDIQPGDYRMALQFASNGGTATVLRVAVQGVK